MFSIATAITRIYPLSLHDALPILMVRGGGFLIGIGIAWRRGLIRLDAPDWRALPTVFRVGAPLSLAGVDRKSTRLNSSHGYISYAVFCLKKKNKSVGGSATTTQLW